MHSHDKDLHKLNVVVKKYDECQRKKYYLRQVAVPDSTTGAG